ncbi:plexin-A4-like [Lingula anatina]|uniref:Plexin-A4-like n=1 Tax=Lingula anatina TaxID=7574 RepID=A0A2R2MLP4_LINAN|nr:plexin-A4-like [Lingula anatina]|eukprot:XP_023931119.1 plexin-A4-like [Lingula anatina]
MAASVTELFHAITSKFNIKLGRIDNSKGLEFLLHKAAGEGHKKLLVKVLEKGISVDFQNDKNQTPLFCAVLQERKNVIDTLLEHGANPNERCDNFCCTPVHLACRIGCVEILEKLLSAGGDLRLHDIDGETPQDWAMNIDDPKRRKKMLDFIEKTRLFAMTHSGRDILLENQSSHYMNRLVPFYFKIIMNFLLFMVTLAQLESQRPGTSQRPGPENCPRIEANFAEILVPSGTTRIVSVKAMALHDFMSSFECKFYKSDRVETVPATKTGSNVIECNPSQAMEFAYVGNAQHQNVRFEITWGSGSRPLDNPSNIQVKVYKCSAMANSCGSCLTMEDKYNCGWCSGQNNVCTIQDQCLGEMDTWLAGNSVCPNPLIHSFSPKTGPIEGGTMVTIRGVNLGKTFADIQDGVNVGDRQCRPLLEYYEPATKIVCITGEVPSAKSKKVQVIVSTRFTASSVDNFSYVVPRINKIFPTLGPRSGGTILNITGTHLNAGSKIRAMVGQLNCTITHINNSTTMGITNNWVTCITSPAEDIIQTRVAMVFDDKAKKLSDEYFSYMKDPNITSVEPDRAVLSGGIRVTVTGEGLNTVQEPKMYVTYQGQDYISPCNSTSASRMICKSPCIMKCDKEEGRRKRDVNPTANTPLELEYGFIMDNVMSVRNYSRNKGDTFSIFPNPEFDSFPGGTKFFQTKNEYLTLNGKNLNLAMNEDDVMIRIGDSFCNVTSISPTQLTCIPPLKQPSSLEGNKDPEVVVSVGDNFRKTLGVIKYEEGGLSLTAIIAIGAGVGAFFLICLLIIILVCVAYRKKSQESDRVMKRMQTQMDVLEIRVAKECKEAFIEYLETDITDSTSDIGIYNDGWYSEPKQLTFFH